MLWEDIACYDDDCGRGITKMTANRRIFLNIIATYGRSLYALIIGLLCGWLTVDIRGNILFHMGYCLTI